MLVAQQNSQAGPGDEFLSLPLNNRLVCAFSGLKLDAGTTAERSDQGKTLSVWLWCDITLGFHPLQTQPDLQSGFYSLPGATKTFRGARAAFAGGWVSADTRIWPRFDETQDVKSPFSWQQLVLGTAIC